MQFVDKSGLHLRQYGATPGLLAGQHPAPGIDHHAVAPGLAPRLVSAALIGSNYVALVFDGASPQQRLPVRLAGHGGKGGGHQQHASSGSGQLAIQLGKAQIITDREAKGTKGGVHHHRRLAGAEGLRLPIATVIVRHIHIKQVDLVVVAPELTAWIKHQRAGVDMVGTGDSRRHGTGHQPDAIIAGPFSQLLLNGRGFAQIGAGVGANRLGTIQIALTFAKEGKVLRQQHQQRPLFGQGGQLGGDLLPVILPVTARYQLYCG